jgi:hypothetical protein
MDEELKGLLDNLEKGHKSDAHGRQKALSAEDAWGRQVRRKDRSDH